MLRRHLALILVLALLTPAVLRAQSPAASASPLPTASATSTAIPPSTVVTVAVDVWPEALDPALAHDGPPTIIGALFEPLVRYKPDSFEFDPATSLAARVAPASDGLVWEIVLKANLTFSDGTPIDAEAVAWNLNRFFKADSPAKPANPAVPVSLKGIVKTVTVRDKANLAIELAAPYSPMMSLLASPHFGLVSPASFKDGKLAALPIGAGPYVASPSTTGRRLLLTPNPKFHHAHPMIPKIDVVHAPVGPARLLWLLSGRGDVVEGLTRRDVEDLAAFPKNKHASAPGLGMCMLYLNPNAAPFQAPLIREAVIRGIPDELLSLVLYEGRADTTRCFLPPWSWGSRQLFKPYGYDQVEAKRLIQTGNIDRNGTAFVMWIVPPDNLRRDVLPPFLESLRASLRELSISCLTEVVPRADLAKRMATQGPQAILYWHEVNVADPDEVVTQSIHKDQPLAKFSNVAAQDDIQSLVVQARTREQVAAREFLYQQIEEKMVGALSTIALGCPRHSVARSERMTGFKFGQNGMVSLEDLLVGP